MNQTCFVELKQGSILTPTVMLVCPPLLGNGIESLETCYETIYEGAFITKGADSLSLGAFSTRPGSGFDPDVAADCAFKVLHNFFCKYPGLIGRKDIHFFIYGKGEYVDERTKAAYAKAYAQYTAKYPTEMKSVFCWIGEIQFFPVDVAVIPVDVNFQEKGALFTAFESAETDQPKQCKFVPLKPQDTATEPPKEVMPDVKPDQQDSSPSVAASPKVKTSITPEDKASFALAGDPRYTLLPHLNCQSINALTLVNKSFHHVYSQIDFQDVSLLCSVLSHSTSRDIHMLMRNNKSFSEAITKATFTADHLRSLLPRLGNNEIDTLMKLNPSFQLAFEEATGLPNCSLPDFGMQGCEHDGEVITVCLQGYLQNRAAPTPLYQHSHMNIMYTLENLIPQVAGFPLALLSSTKEAEIVREWPTFFAMGSPQTQYQQYCQGADLHSISINDQEPCFQQWCTSKDFQKQVNLTVGYDLIVPERDLIGPERKRRVSAEKILALQASIANNKVDGNGCVYVPLHLSVTDVFMMQVLGVFTIPSFFEAYLTPLKLGEPGCPVQVCAEDNDEAFISGINVLAKITFNENSCMQKIPATAEEKEQGIEKVLVSCGSYFECQYEDGKWWGLEENGPVVISLKTTLPQDTLLPKNGNVDFPSWLTKRGFSYFTKDIVPDDFAKMLKAIVKRFDHYFPNHRQSQSSTQPDNM